MISTIEQLEHRIAIENEEANDVLATRDLMFQETKSQCEAMVKEANDFIQSLDPVREAQRLAAEILQEAQQKAQETMHEGEMIRNEMIQHGERVRNQYISQGHDYVSGLFQTSDDLLAKQATDLRLMIQQLAAYKNQDPTHDTPDANERVS